MSAVSCPEGKGSAAEKLQAIFFLFPPKVIDKLFHAESLQQLFRRNTHP